MLYKFDLRLKEDWYDQAFQQVVVLSVVNRT